MIVLNPQSGSAALREPVEAWARGRPGTRVCVPEGAEAACQEACDAARQGALVVAAGGDGTVHGLASALLDADGSRRPRLGVLPLGTGNDLARSLRIPLSIEEALEVLASGVARTVDAVRVRLGERAEWVFNVISGGVGGVVSRDANGDAKRALGPLAYVGAGLAAAGQELEPYAVELVCDGKPVSAPPLLAVVLANGRFAAGGVAVAPDAELGDGWLDLILVEDGPWWHGLQVGARLLAGELTEADGVSSRRVRRVEVRGRPPLPWTFDGEHRGAGPLVATLVPEALEVMVPAPEGTGAPAASAGP